ncbi:MAG TPA: hypothetical protein VKA27_15620 [Sunxiuqinia sp.]|nr:hypothetical protein [Sunxiuqinia sp.]
MKTQKFFMVVIAVMMMTSYAVAGESETSMARRNLNEDIKASFDKEIAHWNNYFYTHNINLMRETVKVSFVVNKDQSLTVFRVISDDPDARNYVKYLFANNNIEAEKVLVGNAYTFDIVLRYEAN